MNRLKLTFILFLTFWFAASFAQPKTNNGVQLKAKTEQNQSTKQGFSFESTKSAVQNSMRSVDEWIHIGTNSSPYGSYNFPIDMYFKTSMSQSIYTAAEINHAPCAVEKLEYTYKTLTSNYPAVITGENFRVWLCNTDVASLSEESGYWIPASNFTLVYEGEIQFTSGVNQKLIVNLTQPFIYSGSNLCIMVEHVPSTQEYQNHFNFNASTLPTGEVRARSYVNINGTPFDFNLPTTDPSQTGMTLGHIADVSIGVSNASSGSLSGTITNTSNNPIENVLVKIGGTDLNTNSNATGQYNFPMVNPGSYNVSYTAFGYNDQTISVNISGATTQDVTMIERSLATVHGTVLDNDNNPIEDVTISISGYCEYSATTTTTNGTFSVPQVYYADGYTLVASKEGYLNHTQVFDVNSPTISLGNIYLSDILEEPSKVTAVKDGNLVNITWLSPSERTVYRRDGGQQELQIGHNFNEELAVFGQVFREPAQLYQMSWYTTFIDESHDFVNVFVFALDANGNPTNNVIFKQNNVPNTDDQWSSFVFPETIVVENGFMIAISYEGRVEIGIDAGLDANYPYVNGVNYLCENYLTDPFLLLEDLGLGEIPGNLMIRAEGYNTNTGGKLGEDRNSQGRSLNGYNLYRLTKGEEGSPTAWTTLATNLTDKNYTDDISSLSSGWYRYAVRGVYSGGAQSDAGFSNTIEVGLTTVVTLNVTANSGAGESVGAIINLASTDGQYNYSYVVENEDGVVNLGSIFKANYNIRITHDGFDDLVMSNVDLSTDETYTLDCELIETLAKPFNLQVEIKYPIVTLKWNHTENIFEDFESCTDFAIEPQGVVNWRYNDVDQLATIGIVSFEYPNENEPHSYMIFNPSQVNPPIDLEANPTIAPYSGEKYLASFGAVNGNNDDYFISPKLNFENDFKFRFKAKSFAEQPAPNKIMVGYSTTGYEPADFTWLTDVVSLPADSWHTYQYTVPANAKHVTIRNVSDGGYILMIDDVEILTGNSKPNSKHLIKYKVYLNDSLMGETTDYTFDFDLSNPPKSEYYVAGVVAVYSSGESEMATTHFSIIGINENAEIGALKVYPNPSNGMV
ncbi:MAG TPA: carboxypeptidase regulatory-like domain-containing protein, partial [Salinivirgaceae bacterium]|nr:carboxypeptidase regulatory-like domain-containing protein [Salinivirgaceae bacterium]